MKADPYTRYAPILARRIPVEEIEVGCAYRIHARNGGIGVATGRNDDLGYRLHRVKFDRHFLFVEYDWSRGEPFGTAIPLQRIDAVPPTEGLLEWLADQEEQHRDAIMAVWDEILGRGWQSKF